MPIFVHEKSWESTRHALSRVVVSEVGSLGPRPAIDATAVAGQGVRLVPGHDGAPDPKGFARLL